MLNLQRELIVVGDEPSTRTQFSNAFSELGYGVRSAMDGFSALALIRELVPDVLLSDLNMPGMSGFELLSVVRRTYPAIHVIATGNEFSGGVVPGIAADAFYEKAAPISQLLDLVKAGTRVPPGVMRIGKEPGPIWIAPTGRLPSTELYVLLSCPECLRAFPELVCEKGSLLCKTECFYCGTSISYVIIHSERIVAHAWDCEELG